MTPRILHTLLVAVCLTVLTTCGTSPRQDDETTTRQGRQPHGIEDDTGVTRRPIDVQRDPGQPSMAEIRDLTLTMTSYQPDVALELIGALENIPSGQLRNLIDLQNYDPEFTEWLALTLQIRTVAITGSAGHTAARQWVDYHYGHVVNLGHFSELVSSYQALHTAPSQVAILLPTEGRLSAAARAIRDGIISAYIDQPGGSVIRFYSSGESSASAIAAYQQASLDGALHIIGPLSIDATRSIAKLAELPTPVLLLNEKNLHSAGNSPPADLVSSLSLSSSEEAAAIAVKALTHGYRRAIVMVPDSAWGTRIESAFSAAFERGDGQITASTRFNTAENDHSAMLTQVLKIDASKQRRSDLQSWLAVPLSFEPIRRYDFDFIFLAANPVAGRELKPLLRFHDAGDVPVFAMGRIYSGRMKRSSDQDLNGVVFAATRFQLEQASGNTTAPDVTTLTSLRGGTYDNLYALGQDAWRLLPWLPLMQKDPDLWFAGEVGALRLQRDGSLYREPAWAQFSAGRPVAYQWPHTGNE